jgi:hypothetical protein
MTLSRIDCAAFVITVRVVTAVMVLIIAVSVVTVLGMLQIPWWLMLPVLGLGILASGRVLFLRDMA